MLDGAEAVIRKTVIDDLFTWCDNVEILGKSWAVAGCYHVRWLSPEVKRLNSGAVAENMIVCHASDAEEYTNALTGKVPKLRTRYTEASIHKYLSACQFTFQSKAVEFTRSEDKFPWGVALLKSLQSEAGTWHQEQHVLTVRHEIARHARASNRPQGSHWAAAVKPEPDDDEPQAKHQKRSAGTPRKRGLGVDAKVKVATAHGGKEFCHEWNGKDSCTNPKCERLHHCDVILANGHPCNSRAHRRIRHDTGVDGEVKWMN